MSTINEWSDDLIGQAVTVRGYGDGFLLRKIESQVAAAYLIMQGEFTAVFLSDCTPAEGERLDEDMHYMIRATEDLTGAVDNMLQCFGGVLLTNAEDYHHAHPEIWQASLQNLLDHMVKVAIKCGGALGEIRDLTRLETQREHE